MADSSKKRRATSDGMMGSSSPKVATPERPKPSFSISEDELPEIKDWTVGKKYHVTAHVEMRSHSKGDSYGYPEGGSKKKHEARLIIHSIKSDGSDDAAK